MLEGFDNPLPQPEKNETYFSALKKAYDQTNAFLPGCFYSFTYKYKSLRTDGKSGNDFAFYDAKPLIYLFGANERVFHGLNFHLLPVDARKRWLDTVDSMTNGAVKRNVPVNIQQDMISSITGKNELFYRHYLVDRAIEMRKLDSSKMWELCAYKTDTIAQISYEGMARNFPLA